MAQFDRNIRGNLRRIPLDRLRELDISIHAAHACYFILLSVFPLLVLMLGILRYTALQPTDLMEFISALLPDALLPAAWKLISSAYANTSRLVVSLSAAVALWSAGRGVYGLQVGLNVVYGVQEQRRWLQSRLICTAYTFLFLLLLLLSLAFNVFGTALWELLRFRPGFHVWSKLAQLRYFLMVFAQALFFCLMYMFLPGQRQGFWETLPGAFFASLGWMVASRILSVYVEYFPRYSNIFGSMYTVALASFWLYICVTILFYGALLNRFLTQPGRKH